jgi:uncharacterized damage-inducible protein DinB
MSESKRIADQLARAHKGAAWHGDSLNETLDGVTAREAVAKPIEGAHSVWELLLHLEAWNRFALEAIHGRKFEVPGDINFPVIDDTTEQAWRSALARFAELKNQLVTEVRAMQDARLKEIVPGREFSFYFLLHGIVQHDLYHAGQIVLLKKAFRTG